MIRHFTIGDRVAIIGKGHPWQGNTGVITAPFIRADFDWTVRLERDDAYSGHECAVAERDLRPERRNAP